MINKIFMYDTKLVPFVMEFEIFSTFNTQELIDYSQKICAFEKVIGESNARTRQSWVRTSATKLVITTQDEQILKAQLGQSYTDKMYTHRIGTPYIDTEESILEINKLTKHYTKSSRILFDNYTEFQFKFFKENFISNNCSSMVLQGIEKQLYSIYRSSSIEVIVMPKSIYFKGISNIETWSSLRNTIFLLNEITQGIDKSNMSSFNLKNSIKSDILQSFITNRMTHE